MSAPRPTVCSTVPVTSRSSIHTLTVSPMAKLYPLAGSNSMRILSSREMMARYPYWFMMEATSSPSSHSTCFRVPAEGAYT